MLQLAVNEFTWDHYQIDTVLWEHRQQPWADVAADYPLVFAQRPVTRQNLRLELPSPGVKGGGKTHHCGAVKLYH